MDRIQKRQGKRILFQPESDIDNRAWFSMNRFYRTVGWLVAVMLSGYSAAGDLQPASGDETPPTIIQSYRPPGPEAELVYHILVAELAGKRDQPQMALENYRTAARLSDNPQVAERAMSIALFLEDDNATLELARRWYALAPGQVRAQQAMAVALLRNRLPDAAIEHLNAVRVANVGDGQQGFAAVNALLNHVKDKALALEVMEKLAARHPESLFALYYYALVALEADRHELALQQLDSALARDPQWGPAYLLRTRVLMDKGDSEAAVAGLARAVEALPRNEALRRGYASLLVSVNRQADAQRQFQILVEQNPKDADALFVLGLLAAEAGQYDEAVAYYQKVLDLGGLRVSDVYFELGKVEEQRKNYSKARDWYARVSSDERYLSAQARIGALLAKLGDRDGVEAHFNKLRQNYPQSAVALYIAESDVWREEKRYQQGFDLLASALTQYPSDKDLLYARALAAERIDRLDILEQDLRTLIEADPSNGHALNALGYTLADRTDRYPEALDYLKRAIALLPDDAAVQDSMGWVLYRLGRHQEALDYLKRAYKQSQDAEIAAHLAEVLWASGQQDEARRVWQEAAQKNPDSEPLLKVKERLSL